MYEQSVPGLIFVTKNTCMENMHNINVQGVIHDWIMSVLHNYFICVRKEK